MRCVVCGGDIERRLVGGLVIYRHQSKALRQSSDHAAKPVPTPRSASPALRVPPTSGVVEGQSRRPVLQEPTAN